MTATAKCPDCDRVFATEADDAHDCAGGDCPSCDAKCWRTWHADVCQLPPIDWRARALAAEAKLDWYEKAMHTPLGELRDREAAAEAIVDDRDQLKAALIEALEWATQTGDQHDKLWATPGGFASELLPMPTRIGNRDRAERIAALMEKTK